MWIGTVFFSYRNNVFSYFDILIHYNWISVDLRPSHIVSFLCKETATQNRSTIKWETFFYINMSNLICNGYSRDHKFICVMVAGECARALTHSFYTQKVLEKSIIAAGNIKLSKFIA